MATEIIDVELDLEKIKQQLNQLDGRFDESKKEAGLIGSEGTKSFKQMGQAIKVAEDGLKQTTATIKEQRNITMQFKRDLLGLESQYKRLQAAQQNGRNLAQQKQLKSQIDQVKEAIKDQTLAQQQLNTKQRDQKEAVKALKDQEKQLSKNTQATSRFDNALKGIAARIVAAFAVERIIRAAVEVGKLAIQMEQLDQKAAIVFEKSLPMVTRESVKSANAIGLTAREFRSAAAGVADILVPLGFARGRSAELAVETTKLAGAISNWSGGQYTAAESAQILQKALVGETEQLKSVGIVVDQTSKQFNERVAILQRDENLTMQQAKALEILRQVTAQSADAQTAFANGADNMAVKLAQANAKAREAGESFAELITPLQISLINAYSNDVGNFSEVLRSNLGTFEKTGLVLRELVFGVFGDTGMDKAVARLKEFQELLSKVGDTSGVDELRAMNEQLKIDLGLTEEIKASSRGLIETLLERKELLEGEIKSATTQAEINRMLTEQESIEKRINDLLNNRPVAKAESVVAPEVFQQITDLDAAWEAAMNSMAVAGKGFMEQFDEDFSNMVFAQVEANAQEAQNFADLQRFKQEQNEATVNASVDLAYGLADATSAIFGEQSQAAKTFAIFASTLDAFAAINKTLATVPAPAGPILATAIGLRAFANVAKIRSTPAPSFYEGTDYLQRGSNPKGRDTIPVWAHEGEAIINASKNKQAPGLAKAWNKGKLPDWIRVKHIEPALRQREREGELQRAAMIATAMGGVFSAELKDQRIVRQLKIANLIGEEQITLVKKSLTRRNPYRA